MALNDKKITRRVSRVEPGEVLLSGDQPVVATGIQERMKLFREFKNLNLSKMAATLGMRQTSYRKYEQIKKSSFPSRDTLQKLSFMGLNINWLLTGAGEMTGPGPAADMPDPFTADRTIGRLEGQVKELQNQITQNTQWRDANEKNLKDTIEKCMAVIRDCAESHQKIKRFIDSGAGFH